MFLLLLLLTSAFCVAASPASGKKRKSVPGRQWKPSTSRPLPSPSDGAAKSSTLEPSPQRKELVPAKTASNSKGKQVSGKRKPAASPKPSRKAPASAPEIPIDVDPMREAASVVDEESIEVGADLRKEIRALKMQAVGFQDVIERLDSELDILKEQSRLMIQRTSIGFRDQFYLRFGVSIVIPRPRTFDFQTDTGTGVFLGLGRYLGKQHVLELSLDWDLYPSATLRYHYEFQSSLSSFVWGPVLAIKSKIAEVGPLDDFLADPGAVKTTFWGVGALVGFPLARSIVSVEVLYLANQQSLFLSNIGFHFFW